MSEFVLPNFPTDVLLEIRIFEHWRLGGSFWLPEIKDLYDVASPKRAGLSKQDTSQGGFNDPILQKRPDPSNTGVRPLHTWQSWGPQLGWLQWEVFGLGGASHLAFTPCTGVQWVRFTPGPRTNGAADTCPQPRQLTPPQLRRHLQHLTWIQNSSHLLLQVAHHLQTLRTLNLESKTHCRVSLLQSKLYLAYLPLCGSYTSPRSISTQTIFYVLFVDPLFDQKCNRKASEVKVKMCFFMLHSSRGK